MKEFKDFDGIDWSLIIVAQLIFVGFLIWVMSRSER